MGQRQIPVGGIIERGRWVLESAREGKKAPLLSSLVCLTLSKPPCLREPFAPQEGSGSARCHCSCLHR